LPGIRHLAFPWRETFPEDDPLSEWLVTLAIAMNDLTLVHVRLDEDQDEPREDLLLERSPSHTSLRRACSLSRPPTWWRSKRSSSRWAPRRGTSTTSVSPCSRSSAAGCSTLATRPRFTIRSCDRQRLGLRGRCAMPWWRSAKIAESSDLHGCEMRARFSPTMLSSRSSSTCSEAWTRSNHSRRESPKGRRPSSGLRISLSTST